MSVVVVDTTVLVNLLHIGRLDLFASIPGYRFLFPEEVTAEVRDETLRGMLTEGIHRGALHVESITNLAEIKLAAEFGVRFGSGESACLAVAHTRGLAIATDDAKAISEARERLGHTRILTTPGLMVLAIRAGVLKTEEADAYKATLETRRFTMGFASFRDVV